MDDDDIIRIQILGRVRTYGLQYLNGRFVDGNTICPFTGQPFSPAQQKRVRKKYRDSEIDPFTFAAMRDIPLLDKITFVINTRRVSYHMLSLFRWVEEGHITCPVTTLPFSTVQLNQLRRTAHDRIDQDPNLMCVYSMSHDGFQSPLHVVLQVEFNNDEEQVDLVWTERLFETKDMIVQLGVLLFYVRPESLPRLMIIILDICVYLWILVVMLILCPVYIAETIRRKACGN
jgi:hypothetical protein